MSILQTFFNNSASYEHIASDLYRKIDEIVAGDNMTLGADLMKKVIRQSVTVKAAPHQVFETLMDSEKHSRLTGHRVYISRRVGGRVEICDALISGTNLELVADRKIVQSWRSNDWPEDQHSRVTIVLDQNNGHTKLALIQTGVPEEDYERIKQNWRENYWKPLKDMLEKLSDK